jgi:hypothetical protein
MFPDSIVKKKMSWVEGAKFASNKFLNFPITGMDFGEWLLNSGKSELYSQADIQLKSGLILEIDMPTEDLHHFYTLNSPMMEVSGNSIVIKSGGEKSVLKKMKRGYVLSRPQEEYCYEANGVWNAIHHTKILF